MMLDSNKLFSEKSLRGIVANVLDCGLEVSKFELQSHC